MIQLDVSLFCWDSGYTDSGELYYEAYNKQDGRPPPAYFPPSYFA